jgi:methionine sulfoxide reductase heme-binding subunit
VTSSHALWYLARGSATAALVALTLSLALGQLLAGGYRSRLWPRASSNDVHRTLSIAAAVLIGVHVSAVLADSFLPFGLLDAVIPFRAPYRSLWVGFGTLAFDFLVLVLVATAARRRIGWTLWRRLHWLSYGVWALAVVHGLGAGTDTATVWLRVVSVACVALVVAGTIRRVSGDGRQALVGAGAAAVAAFMLAIGLTHTARAATALPATNAISFDWTADQSSSLGVVSMVGTGPNGQMHFRLDVVQDTNGIKQSLVQVSSTGGPNCRGTITQLSDGGADGTCGGRPLILRFSSLSQGSGQGELTLGSPGA